MPVVALAGQIEARARQEWRVADWENSPPHPSLCNNIQFNNIHFEYIDLIWLFQGRDTRGLGILRKEAGWTTHQQTPDKRPLARLLTGNIDGLANHTVQPKPKVY
jgi:hypothetical protein